MNHMVNNPELIRELLPDKVKKSFDDIVNQVVLGASNHIRMIGDMIQAIALEGQEKSEDVMTIVNKIKEVSKYFIATRGEASQAISNAIYIMIEGINDYTSTDDVNYVVNKIIEKKDSYNKKSKTNIEKVVEYSVKVAKDMENIFVYDYSSTVEKFLRALVSNNKKYTIYIAESRVIDGGYPFVKACEEAGHNIKFIPDSAIMYNLVKCDAAFMGAETFFADGTGFNTTGSDIVGLVCHTYNIPLYFLTPMIKLDTTPIYGGTKNIVFNDLKKKLSSNWSEDINVENIDFVTPELIGVNPDHIRAFITELGVIPSKQLYNISLDYSKSMKEGLE